MTDGGSGGDGAAGDGVFTAVLPAATHGTVVEFYIEASDGSGGRTWPGATDLVTGTRGADLLYQVDDEVAAGGFPFYRLVMTVAEDAEFDSLPLSSNANTTTDAQFNATFIALTPGGEVEVRYQCGVRLRGAGSRADYPRSLRVNLPRDTPWESKTSLNLNSQFPYLQYPAARCSTARGSPASTRSQCK
jgi:hypothetical protein